MTNFTTIFPFLLFLLGAPLFTASAVAQSTTGNSQSENAIENEDEETVPDADNGDQPAADGLHDDGALAVTNNAEPEVSHDLQALPFPTRRMHELILEATQSGDIEKLRPLIGTGESATQVSLGTIEEDPVDFLKSLSGDPEGHEILAILQEILEAGYVHLDKGTSHELYVWPYFFGVSLEKLDAGQMVDLFRIVTYGDYADFKDFGGYIFYRVGITPTGRWAFFVAGD